MCKEEASSVTHLLSYLKIEISFLMKINKFNGTYSGSRGKPTQTIINEPSRVSYGHNSGGIATTCVLLERSRYKGQRHTGRTKVFTMQVNHTVPPLYYDCHHCYCCAEL